MRDLAVNLKVAPAMSPGTYAADEIGVAIDTSGANSIALMASIGPGGDTFTATKRIDVVMEHSDDGQAWEAVADDDVTGVANVENGVVLSLRETHPDDTVHGIGYIGYRRFIRASLDFNGTHAAGTPVSIVAVQGDLNERPVAA